MSEPNSHTITPTGSNDTLKAVDGILTILHRLLEGDLRKQSMALGFAAQIISERIIEAGKRKE